MSLESFTKAADLYEGKTRRRREILQRANEHEMNVDSGDERPVKGFKRLVALIDKKKRTSSEWEELDSFVSKLGPAP